MLIGEVSQQAGISTRMLRHYDSLGLVSPTGRTVGGYREYSADDIRRLFHVESLRSLGLSLRDLQRALDDPGFTPTGLIGELIAATEERIAREQELLRRLRQVKDHGPSEWTEVLRLVSLMRGLDSDDPSRRQRSVLAIGGEPSPPVKLLAEAVLAEPDPNVAGALRWALQRANDEALVFLAPGLDSPEPETRHRAVIAIGELDAEGSATILAAALTHTDPVVRRHAALTLGARGDTRAIAELIAMVVVGADDVEASEVLGELARQFGMDDEIAGSIADQLTSSEASFDVRLRLTQALAELRGPVADAALEALAEDPDHRIVLTAASVARARSAQHR